MKNHSGQKFCVRNVPIFNHLTDKEMNEVFSKVHSTGYRKNEHLFMAGDPEQSLYVLHRGKIRIYRLTDDGKEQLIRVLQPGEFTGELSLFGTDRPHESYAEIMEKSQICEITKDDIYGLMKEYPDIGIKIIEKFSERLEAAEQQTTNISLLSSEERLLEYFRSHVDADDYVKLEMTKRDLSSYLSMQPETLTRLFKKLEAQGDIEKLDNRTYRVLSYSIL